MLKFTFLACIPFWIWMAVNATDLNSIDCAEQEFIQTMKKAVATDAEVQRVAAILCKRSHLRYTLADKRADYVSGL